MTQHLEAISIIIGQPTVWVFYALFAVAGVVLAINFMVELTHRLLKRVVRSER